ncbi:Protein DC2.5 [Aphelenchoides avenae]|nr:Protein DC2.5 [Aphelenchus avenae]
MPVAKSMRHRRKFGPRTPALEVLKDLDLKGKTILVTGTTSGIGIETARALALKGAHVVMANRNAAASESLRDTIYKETEHRNIDIIHCNLSSLQSVQAAAKEFLSKGWPLHVLLLNAGVLAPTQKASLGGYETTFATNHLAHFYLTYLLLDKLRASAPSRLVVVSSTLHSQTGIKPSLPTDAKLARLIPYPNTTESGYRRYNYSKLCNILFAFKVHRDEHKNGINTYALHPGSMIGTSKRASRGMRRRRPKISGITQSYGVLGKIGNTLIKPFTKTVEQGAATSVYCAVSPDVENDSGKYYESCWDDEKELQKTLAHDTELQDALWQKSLEMIQKFEAGRPSN